jgi:site-specific DNA recombinase
MRRRAVLYLRVSTRDQEDGYSLDTQDAACRKHCAETNTDVIEVIREVHTGVELWERTGLTRVREIIRGREQGITVAVAFSIDRLARDPVHLGVVISEADHVGACVEFASEPLDDSPEGQLIRFVRGYAAKVEHEKIKERSARGRLARLDSGRPLPGCRAPYGLSWTTGEKVALRSDPVAAPIVQRLFRGLLGGATTRRLAQGLMDSAVPAPKGGTRWSNATVRYIVTNPIYHGRWEALRFQAVKLNGRYRTLRRPESDARILDVDVEPLITVLEFERAQVQLQRNQALSPRNNKDPESALLRGGYVRCSHCGRSMYVWRAYRRHGQDVLYYRCSSRDYMPTYCRPATQLPVPQLDRVVWEKITEVLRDPEQIRQQLEQTSGPDPSQSDLEAIDRHLQQLSARQQNLARALATLNADAQAPVVVELESLAKQRVQLQKEQTILRSQSAARVQAREQAREVTEWCRGIAAKLSTFSYEEKRNALQALGVRVLVLPATESPRYQVLLDMELEITNTRSDGSARNILRIHL